MFGSEAQGIIPIEVKGWLSLVVFVRHDPASNIAGRIFTPKDLNAQLVSEAYGYERPSAVSPPQITSRAGDSNWALTKMCDCRKGENGREA